MPRQIAGFTSLLLLVIVLLGVLMLPACNTDTTPTNQPNPTTTTTNPFTPVPKTTTTNPFTPVPKTTTNTSPTTTSNAPTTTVPPTTTTAAPTTTTATDPTTSTSPTTTEPVDTGIPTEVEGVDPWSIPRYPDSIRIAYITMCVCTPTVTTWYAAPDDPQVVLDFYKDTLVDEGWEVKVESTGDAMWAFKDDEDDVYINVLEGEQYPDYPSEINVFWYNYDHYQG